MKPSARIQAVIDVLDAIALSRVPMDTTIGDYMRSRRYIGSKDRRYIVETVYDMMRAYARVAWWLEKAGSYDDSRTRTIAWLSLGEKLNALQISDLFNGAKYAPATLSSKENDLAAKLEGQPFVSSEMPEAVQVECPPDYEETLRSYFGQDFLTEMKAMMDGATLDLRVNTSQTDLETVQKSLEKDGVKAEPTPYSPWGLRCENKAFLSRTKAFSKGWIDIQDEGSQLIAFLCDTKPGMNVLDYCAGGGGKTLALAAPMKNKGRIVACDIDPKRLERAKPRLKRAKIHDIVGLRALSEEQHRKWFRRQKATMDVVLVDVPCTGTGTWRRNPDTRWVQYGPPLEELIQIQTEILDKVAKTVKPGGRLIYATCSLLPEENEKQIEAFLNRHNDYEILPLKDAWPKGTPVPNEGDFMRLTPHRHNTDGFFAAVLLKKRSN